MENFIPENTLFKITIADIQYEAMEKIGRELTEDELLVAQKGLESGLMFDIDSVYSAIFERVTENEF